jgi:hypothetical protein
MDCLALTTLAQTASRKAGFILRTRAQVASIVGAPEPLVSISALNACRFSLFFKYFLLMCWAEGTLWHLLHVVS